jgi:hypothetical protein
MLRKPTKPDAPNQLHMSSTDKSLLEELEKTLDGNIHKYLLRAYLKVPSSDSIVVATVAALEKLTAKHEDS